MLFERRQKLTRWQKIKRFIWPETGFRRANKYLFYRLVRLPGSVHSIAAGVASGAAVSFTPFIGLHFILGFVLAWMTRGNMLASAFGTVIGNPWTFPLIFALTGSIGQNFLGGAPLGTVEAISFNGLIDDPWNFFIDVFVMLKPFIIGGIPVALIVWFLFYAVMKLLLDSHFEKVAARKSAKLSEKLNQNKNENAS